MFVVGDIIDDMKVISYEGKTKNWVKLYKVKCLICDSEKIIQLSRLKNHTCTKHNNKSCNYSEKYDSNIGLTINDYTIIKRTNRRYSTTYYYLARCNICGCEFETTIGNFKRFGNTHKECSCHIKPSKYLKRFRKIYSCMRYRTTNSKSSHFNVYGGKGISSDYYSDFMVFYKELFESYKEHVDKYGEKNTTLDRINSNGNYEKGNVRWATINQQANNRSDNVFFKIGNESKTLANWCRAYKKDYSTVFNRVHNLGWDIERALDIPKELICN